MSLEQLNAFGTFDRETRWAGCSGGGEDESCALSLTKLFDARLVDAGRRESASKKKASSTPLVIVALPLLLRRLGDGARSRSGATGGARWVGNLPAAERRASSSTADSRSPTPPQNARARARLHHRLQIEARRSVVADAAHGGERKTAFARSRGASARKSPTTNSIKWATPYTRALCRAIATFSPSMSIASTRAPITRAGSHCRRRRRRRRTRRKTAGAAGGAHRDQFGRDRVPRLGVKRWPPSARRAHGAGTRTSRAWVVRRLHAAGARVWCPACTHGAFAVEI